MADNFTPIESALICKTCKEYILLDFTHPVISKEAERFWDKEHPHAKHNSLADIDDIPKDYRNKTWDYMNLAINNLG